MKTPTRDLVRDLGLIITITVLLALASSLAAQVSDPKGLSGTVRLHDQVAVIGPEVRLQDVADLDGPLGEALAGTVVGTFPEGRTDITVLLGSLREVLDNQHVNWARLKLCGHEECRVERIEARPPARAQAADPLILTNPTDELDLDTARTLQDLVVRTIERFSGVSRSDLDFGFRPGDAPVLARSAPGAGFIVEPMSEFTLGRVPLLIRRIVSGRTAETISISVDVSRRYLAAVLTRDISRGQTLIPGDIQVREVSVNDVRGEPLTGELDALGQIAATRLRAGMVLYPRHLRSPRLVQRGDLVTVRFVSGHLAVKTVGRATEDGALDDLITVRNERSREVFPVRVTGFREARVDGETESLPSMGH